MANYCATTRSDYFRVKDAAIDLTLTEAPY
jgi:hypothetical protein